MRRRDDETTTRHDRSIQTCNLTSGRGPVSPLVQAATMETQRVGDVPNALLRYVPYFTYHSYVRCHQRRRAERARSTRCWCIPTPSIGSRRACQRRCCRGMLNLI
eukprot:1645794-Pyramimonas_sp.AAC.1